MDGHLSRTDMSGVLLRLRPLRRGRAHEPSSPWGSAQRMAEKVLKGCAGRLDVGPILEELIAIAIVKTLDTKQKFEQTSSLISSLR